STKFNTTSGTTPFSTLCTFLRLQSVVLNIDFQLLTLMEYLENEPLFEGYMFAQRAVPGDRILHLYATSSMF
ncbi:hypothetical protein, partial [Priestia sp. YIM B13486]|uniref:hypothetical protein n=1 Tax=Priestia sp. YIM B13486 TaxID=3366304 RepID=UPI00366A6899